MGFDQKAAVDLGLDMVDLFLLNEIREKAESANIQKTVIEGKDFVWISYQSLLERFPILGFSRKTLGQRLDRMVKKNILERRIGYSRNGVKGTFTFYSNPCLQNGRPGVVKTAGGVPKKQQPKSTPNKSTPIKEKEKEINKFISKKKDGVNEFEVAFGQFSAKAVEDGELLYNLRSYRITDMSALIEAFRKHVTNLCRLNEFVANGYMRNRRWLLNAMPYLDVSAATGLTLGKGEYLKDNRRYYINPAGRECEVPLDAPPRQLRDQIWYANERRWGPNV